MRVLVADDHAMFREMLKIAIPRDGDLQVVGEAADGVEVASLTERLSPDVVLLDYKMPHVRDFAVLVREIRTRSVRSQVIVLSAFASIDIATRAAQGGAHGYVLKSTRLSAVADALRTVAQGGIWIDPALPRKVFEVFQQYAEQAKGRTPGLASLTRREREVLGHVARGISNRQISTALCVSEQTVKTHLTRIFAKLRVTNRLGAALAYFATQEREDVRREA